MEIVRIRQCEVNLKTKLEKLYLSRKNFLKLVLNYLHEIVILNLY